MITDKEINDIINNNKCFDLINKSKHTGCFDENGKEVTFTEMLIDICAYNPKGYTYEEFASIKTRLLFDIKVKPLWEAAQIRKQNINTIKKFNKLQENIQRQYIPKGKTAKFQLSAKEQAAFACAVEKGLLKKENNIYTLGDGINKSVIIFFLSRLFCGDYEKDGIWYISRNEKLPNNLLCKMFNQNEMTALRNKSEAIDNDWKFRKMPNISNDTLQTINTIINDIK